MVGRAHCLRGGSSEPAVWSAPVTPRDGTASAWPLLGAVVFLGGSVLSIVWLNEWSTGAPWAALLPQTAGALVAGLTLGAFAWTALALAFVPVLIASPFGDAEIFREGPPIALFELYLLPGWLALIGLGAIWSRRRDAGVDSA